MTTKNLAGYGSIATATLTALSGAPYTLGDVATIVPPAWKEPLFIVMAIATAILRLMRDRQSAVK